MSDDEQTRLGASIGDPDARGGVYVRFDLDANAVVFVGRSVDVHRRLDWWGGREDTNTRIRGVIILQSDDEFALRAVEQKALDTYGSLRPDPGEVPGRGD